MKWSDCAYETPELETSARAQFAPTPGWAILYVWPARLGLPRDTMPRMQERRRATALRETRMEPQHKRMPRMRREIAPNGKLSEPAGGEGVA